MGQDTPTVTPQMLRKWHEEKFPGLTDTERAERIWGKWIEESREFHGALQIYFDNPTVPALEDVRGEAADVLLTLMSLGEFLGFNVSREAVLKHNINTNRIWVQDGVDENGKPVWKRERDNRPDLLKNRPSEYGGSTTEGVV